MSITCHCVRVYGLVIDQSTGDGFTEARRRLAEPRADETSRGDSRVDETHTSRERETERPKGLPYTHAGAFRKFKSSRGRNGEEMFVTRRRG